MRPGLLLLAICLATSPVEALRAQAGAKVTVYRCTDAAASIARALRGMKAIPATLATA